MRDFTADEFKNSAAPRYLRGFKTKEKEQLFYQNSHSKQSLLFGTSVLTELPRKRSKIKVFCTRSTHCCKKVVATASRCERVYKRTGEPSVPFCERGGTTARVTDFSKKEKSERSKVRSDVGAGEGFEPPTSGL